MFQNNVTYVLSISVRERNYWTYYCSLTTMKIAIIGCINIECMCVVWPKVHNWCEFGQNMVSGVDAKSTSSQKTVVSGKVWFFRNALGMVDNMYL